MEPRCIAHAENFQRFEAGGDGNDAGYRYFDAEMGHGVFAVPSCVRMLDGPAGSTLQHAIPAGGAGQAPIQLEDTGDDNSDLEI